LKHFSLARYSGRGSGEGLFLIGRRALTLALSRSTGRGNQKTSLRLSRIRRADCRAGFLSRVHFYDCVFARVGADRPDAFRAAPVAYEIDAAIGRPERHDVVAAAIGEALAVGAVHVDGPDIGLAARRGPLPLAD